MFNEVVPPNQESRDYVFRLKILSITFLVLGILKFQNTNFLFQDIISALLLFCSFYQLNYCLLIFFILSSIFNLIYYINYFGVILSKNIYLQNSFFNIIAFITFLTYIYSNYLCFKSYKCFKKLAVNNNSIIPLQQNQNNYNNQANYNNENNNGGGNEFKAFTGKGIKL